MNTMEHKHTHILAIICSLYLPQAYWFSGFLFLSLSLSLSHTHSLSVSLYVHLCKRVCARLALECVHLYLSVGVRSGIYTNILRTSNKVLFLAQQAGHLLLHHFLLQCPPRVTQLMTNEGKQLDGNENVRWERYSHVINVKGVHEKCLPANG